MAITSFACSMNQCTIFSGSCECIIANGRGEISWRSMPMRPSSATWSAADATISSSLHCSFPLPWKPRLAISCAWYAKSASGAETCP